VDEVAVLTKKGGAGQETDEALSGTNGMSDAVDLEGVAVAIGERA